MKRTAFVGLQVEEKYARYQNTKIQNPIISGYNPDPSICRVGDDFYLVNSTFEFYPGVPVYHSKNLVNWELINYCLRDKEQLYLDGVRPSRNLCADALLP